MIVSTWALAIGAGGLIAAGFYIMACHNFMNGLMRDNQILVAILEQVKEELNED
jgi:hypothetical protein